jgi:hypothetical protein
MKNTHKWTLANGDTITYTTNLDEETARQSLAFGLDEDELTQRDMGIVVFNDGDDLVFFLHRNSSNRVPFSNALMEASMFATSDIYLDRKKTPVFLLSDLDDTQHMPQITGFITFDEAAELLEINESVMEQEVV